MSQEVALALRTFNEHYPEQVGWEADVVPAVFADWQLTGAIAPLTSRRAEAKV
jgi:hypothetical protein